MSETQLLAQLDQYSDLAAPRVDEPVIAACPMFHRGMLTLKAAGHFGFLARLAAKKAYARRASGLPESFVLAVTPTSVHAFDAPVKGAFKSRAPELGDEVAVWDRSDLQITWKKGGPMVLDVTIVSGDETYNV